MSSSIKRQAAENRIKSFLKSMSDNETKFLEEYKQFCENQSDVEKFHQQFLVMVHNAIMAGSINDFRKLTHLVEVASQVEDKLHLEMGYNYHDSPFKSTNVVIFTCKCQQVAILEFLLTSTFLKSTKTVISPDDKDCKQHNAFYYAIRSNVVELFNILLKCWPRDSSIDFFQIIADAYEELVVTVTPFIAKKMVQCVETFLLNYRWGQKFEYDSVYLKNRIDFMLERITIIIDEYSDVKEVDDKFIYCIQNVSKDINFLKRFFRHTYQKIPWEEMDILLTHYVQFYAFCLHDHICNAARIVKFLKPFKDLFDQVDLFNEKVVLSNLKRHQVISRIACNNPILKEFYEVFSTIRNMFIITELKVQVELILTADVSNKVEQLAIVRFLQLFSNFLKDDLQSPNLSRDLSELFMALMPDSIYNIVLELKNSSSDSMLLSNLVKLEKKGKTFFANVQLFAIDLNTCLRRLMTLTMYNQVVKYLIGLDSSTVDKLSNRNIHTIKFAITRLESHNEVTYMDFYKLLQTFLRDVQSHLLEENEKEDFVALVSYLEIVLPKITDICSSPYINSMMELRLGGRCGLTRNKNALQNYFKFVQEFKKILNPYALEVEVNILTQITMKLFFSLKETLDRSVYRKLKATVLNILTIAEVVCSDSYSIKMAKERLIDEQKSPVFVGQLNVDHKKAKVKELTDFLKNHPFGAQPKRSRLLLFPEPTGLKDNALELLIFEILLCNSDVEDTSVPDDFFIYLHEQRLKELFITKNSLVDYFNPILSIEAISEKLTKCNSSNNVSLVKGNFNFREEFTRGLNRLANRQTMFMELEKGNLKSVKNCLKTGADILSVQISDLNNSSFFASKSSNINCMEFVTKQKCILNGGNNMQETPLHMAAGAGNKKIVEFLITVVGMNANDRNDCGNKAIHYAAEGGHVKVVEMLFNYTNISSDDISVLFSIAIENLNFPLSKLILEKFGKETTIFKGMITILELAEENNFLELISYLVNNNNTANINGKSLNESYDIEKLLEAIKRNDVIEVKNHVKKAPINNMLENETTLLHFAVSNNQTEIAEILLEANADPNVQDKEGFYPLHHAAMSGNFRLVTLLLTYNAMYNAESKKKRKPLDLAEGKKIAGFLKLIDELFNHVKNNNSKAVTILGKVTDLNQKRAIWGAFNKDKYSLIVLAYRNNYSDLKELKSKIFNDFTVNMPLCTLVDICSLGVQIDNITTTCNLILKKIEFMFKKDNPLQLEMSRIKALSLFKQRNYIKCYELLKEIHMKQEQMVGAKHMETLITKSFMGFALYQLGRINEADVVLKKCVEEQIEILGPKHGETMISKFYYSVVLKTLGKVEEALVLNKETHVFFLEKFGPDDYTTLSSQKNLANILSTLGKCKEAGKMIQDVYEREKKIFGENHLETLQTLKIMAMNNSKMRAIASLDDANETRESAENLQQQLSDAEHPEILLAHTELGKQLTHGENLTGGNEILTDVCKSAEKSLDANHSNAEDIKRRMEPVNVSSYDIHEVASKNNVICTEKLLKMNCDPNLRDEYGRTPLHYAAWNGNAKMVNLLIRYGADVKAVSHKGNTPLFSAVARGHETIVDILLSSVVERENLLKFVNAKTILHGTTCLHVAAKEGFLSIFLKLLENGAMFNIQNTLGKTPKDLTTDSDIDNHLNFLELLFSYAESGKQQLFICLKNLKADFLKATLNARNNEGRTLVEDLLSRKYDELAKKMSDLLKI